jgi:phospholipid/cholesterol/gamma-HCH transport system substrate-binding protein
MRGNLTGAALRMGIFTVISLLGVAALVMVFAQLRFQSEIRYRAEFSNVSGLEAGNFVRIAGVEVGKVKNIVIQQDKFAVVEFTADDSVLLTEGTRAAIRYDNLIGGRYLALDEGVGAVKRLPVGATIPLQRTEPALDLDALIGGFRPLFRALNPGQVNALSTQLISAFQGQGATIGSILTQTASLTAQLADRDQLIGQVVTNLNVVLGSLGDRSDQFAKALDSLSSLLKALAERRNDVSNAIAYGNAGAGALTDLLVKGRPAFQETVHQTDRVSATVESDHDYFDNLLNTLPDAYRILDRQGLYGDFFNFYLCDLFLKVNGKGGQPVYVKLAGQSTGRCTPK